jgi:DNA-binding response OmpR family regulator
LNVPEQGRSILVIDDDPGICEVIADLLLDAGFRVEIAHTSEQALAVIDRQAVDLVVADIRLPGGLNGLETTREARRRRPGLPCLFISGQFDPVVCDPELDEFVPKPFLPAEFLGCVLKVLQGNRPYPRISIARG